LITEVTTTAVEQLSPSFVRVHLGGPGLADFGVDGPTYDQRIKLVFPNAAGRLPVLGDDTWWTDYLELPEEERGSIRTYTIRDVVGEGVDTRLVVDIVVHPEPHGPGSSWALHAATGDRLLVVCPRKGEPPAGIEFRPTCVDRLLLVADETAVPAVAAILEQLPPEASGAAFLEVPTAADVQELTGPEGVEVTWLPREGAAYGALLDPAVLDHLGVGVELPDVDDAEVPDLLWETPDFSGGGEQVEPSPAPEGELYAWIAGESKVVTALRRVLVKDLGFDRSQVAFMGYWREGVAMRA